MRLWTNFHVALTFLTRFGRAKIVSSQEIQRSMVMFPLVGWVMGVILLLLTMLSFSSWVLAWILVAANIVITRGLHWDGWADLWDAWGSGATGERFWIIVKDSHIGAFGTMGLVLGLGSLASTYELAIENQHWLTLAWSCAMGRFSCLGLACLSRNLARPGLGQQVLRGATKETIFWGAIITFMPALFLPLEHLVLTIFLDLLALVILLGLGKRQQGLNGDFLGAAIIAGELSALLPLAF